MHFKTVKLTVLRNEIKALVPNIVEKENISDLYLRWGMDREDLDDNVLNVLEMLQPHKNLRAVMIHYFVGEHLPNGIFVENFVELRLFNCYKCETLPMLGHFSKLEVLKIDGLRALKIIREEFYGNYDDGRTLFPNLKTFHISNMICFEQWKEVVTVTNCTTFPHLESLIIDSCLRLMSIPNIFATHSQRLKTNTVNARLFSSFQTPPKF